MKIWCLKCGNIIAQADCCGKKRTKCPCCSETMEYSVKNGEATIECVSGGSLSNNRITVVSVFKNAG